MTIEIYKVVSKPADYKATWSNSDYPELIGRKTLMTMIRGKTCLLIEGLHFQITN